jgi:hypothetical protein
MDLVTFAIWKFRYIEGILKGMHAFDMCTTKYVDPLSDEVSWIRYDFEKEKATVEHTEEKHTGFFGKSEPVTRTVECKFSDLPQTLKDLGMYHQLPSGEHHMLAGQQTPE